MQITLDDFLKKTDPIPSKKELYPGYDAWSETTLWYYENIKDRTGRRIDWYDACEITDRLGYWDPIKAGRRDQENWTRKNWNW